MQKLHNKGLIYKLLICTIAIIMLCNFTMPNYVYAKTDTDGGGTLLKSIAQFAAFLCDKVMEWLQHTFTSTDDIEQDDGTYSFKYSPGIIFSGTVPALDINFIKPQISKTDSMSVSDYFKDSARLSQWVRSAKTDENSQYKKDFDSASTNSQYSKKTGSFYLVGMADAGNQYNYTIYYKVSEDKKTLTACCKFEFVGIGQSNSYYSFTEDISSVGEALKEKTYESTAEKLQDTIATWYKALRRIALVGLLSVLAYIGIRIVLSSSSPQDQSKYKKMMTDWLVAICLLFTLHYLMSITLTVTKEISNIFNTGETDELLNTLRYDIKYANGTNSWGVVVGEVIMYAALVIFTVKYTIQYLKRVIYMAFYTLIAPLITLTYPLDKIKDGQAQAFGIWIKEYIYTALVQVVHLVIYFTLVSSAMALVKNYPLYAIIAIMFMQHAENVFKRMFGFDKAETVGTLGAAVTGGLVMNALNSMKKPPKPAEGERVGATSGGGNGKNVRTSKGDPLAGLRTTNNTQQLSTKSLKEEYPEADIERAERFKKLVSEGVSQDEALERINGVLPLNRNKNTESKEQNPNPSNINNIKPEENAATQNGGQRPDIAGRTERKPDFWSGVRTLSGRYVRPAIGKVAGIALGGVGATIGFASGVAQGDIGKALTGLAGGAAAGYYGGQKATNAVTNAIPNARRGINNVVDTYNMGARGEEYVQNARFDREFMRSESYRGLRNDAKELYGNESNAENYARLETDVKTMLNAGITDEKAMKKIIQNSHGNLEEEIGYYTLAKKCPENIFTDKDTSKLEQYLSDLGLNQTQVTTIRDRMKVYR